jgi:hypothetical protein
MIKKTPVYTLLLISTFTPWRILAQGLLFCYVCNIANHRQAQMGYKNLQLYLNFYTPEKFALRYIQSLTELLHG